MTDSRRGVEERGSWFHQVSAPPPPPRTLAWNFFERNKEQDYFLLGESVDLVPCCALGGNHSEFSWITLLLMNRGCMG